MEEEKGERGERKQRAPEENNRNDLTEKKKKVCDEAAADFFFYVSDSASFLCILFSVSCRDNILRMVRFSLCTKTTEEEIMFGLKIPGSVNTNTTGRCPDASLTDWIFLRTFADIFLCRQIWMFLRNTGAATKTVILLFSSGHVTSTSCLLCGLFFSFSSLQSSVRTEDVVHCKAH